MLVLHAVEAGYSVETEAAELVRPVRFRPDHMLAPQSSPHPMAHDMRVCIRMCGVCAPDCSAAVLVYHGISCSTNDQESQIPDANHPRTSMV